MLAVVDPFAGLRIGEGGRAPAEHRLRLEHDAPARRARQCDGRAQARDAGADDDDVRRCHFSGTITFSHVSAGDHRLPRARHADVLAEDIVAGPLDRAQQIASRSPP